MKQALLKVVKRLKNKKVLFSVISGILMILVNLNVIEGEVVNNLLPQINTALGILVGIGILSNPDKGTEPKENIKG